MKLCRREVEKAMRPLLKYAYALCRDSDLACDLVQDSVVKALSTEARPDEDKPYLPWLFSILRNVFFDHLRKNRRLNEFEHLAYDGEIDALASPKLDESLINRMTVRCALERVSPAHRELLVLIDVIGFSYKEAAELLGIPEGTIMSRLSRARAQLRNEISVENLHSLDQMRVSKGRKKAQ